MAKVSVMELVHNGFLYPRETKAVSSLYALLTVATLHKSPVLEHCHSGLHMLPCELRGKNCELTV